MKASFALSVTALAAVAQADPRNFTTIQPTGYFDQHAATAVQTVYPKDHHTVKGRVVDHLWHIVLDSADYDDAKSNSDFEALAKEGLLLTNYYGLTHPAQPNYLGMIAGDYFGLNEEKFVALPQNVSTIVDLFEDQRMNWAQYAEDQPFTAYDGWEYKPHGEDSATYSRAKNPFVAFDSVLHDSKRLVNLRSLATFHNDWEAKRMPQWLMIRPNLQHDGSKSDLDTAAKWVRKFLEPHLSEKKNYHRHLYLVTFAHSKSTSGANHVYSLLLGDLDKDYRGSTDDTYYDHYSIISSTAANFELPNLGRFDCKANVFKPINDKGHTEVHKQSISDDYNSQRSTGWLSDTDAPLPIPNLQCEGAGKKGVPSKIKKVWKKASYSYFQWTVNY